MAGRLASVGVGVGVGVSICDVRSMNGARFKLPTDEIHQCMKEIKAHEAKVGVSVLA